MAAAIGLAASAGSGSDGTATQVVEGGELIGDLGAPGCKGFQGFRQRHEKVASCPSASYTHGYQQHPPRWSSLLRRAPASEARDAAISVLKYDEVKLPAASRNLSGNL